MKSLRSCFISSESEVFALVRSSAMLDSYSRRLSKSRSRHAETNVSSEMYENCVLSVVVVESADCHSLSMMPRAPESVSYTHLRAHET
jgi:hypothetical protein